jgi:DNA adenine methylase
MPKTLKSLKTPLRYPGGKSRAVVKLLQYLPDLTQAKEFREPFLGGGSVALEITKRYPHIEIWVNDLYEPLYNFWCELQHNGQDLQDALLSKKNFYPDPDTARKLFNQSKEEINDPDLSSFDRAVAFYIVNKCSFSGLTESSSFSEQASQSNFSFNGIDRLVEYSELIEGWTITNLSYERMLCDDKNVFTYLDPPYDIKDNLYGRKGGMHKSFNHDEFAEWCDRFTSPMLISYNSDQIVKDRFKEWSVGEFAHTYTMRSVGCYNKDQATRKELVLTNYEM